MFDILKKIESDIVNKEFGECIKKCLENKYYILGSILAFNYNIEIPKIRVEEENMTRKRRVMLMGNWTDSNTLANQWNHMSQGNYTWNNIEIVWNEPVDYYVIINSPPPNNTFVIDKKKTIVFQMEPYMPMRPQLWKEWANPKEEEFLKLCKHQNGEYNNNEWHLSLTYKELSETKIVKNSQYDNILSTILSEKYVETGHIKRVDFVKFLEKKGMTVHVYGKNRWDYKNYMGSLPLGQKEKGLFPYKYTFNAENNDIPFYYTEKLIDGILSECLTFYWGCPNIKNLLDPQCYVVLGLSNFENDYNLIKKAISEDWHSQRLPYIRAEKTRILNELQFFPRLEKIINENEYKRENHI